MTTTMNHHYTVIVRDPNSWSASTGIHTATDECEHRHRTYAAAERCRTNLLTGNTRRFNTCEQPNSWSARWDRAKIEVHGAGQILATGYDAETYR